MLCLKTALRNNSSVLSHSTVMIRMLESCVLARSAEQFVGRSAGHLKNS